MTEQWKEAYPIETATEEKLSRRKLLQSCAVGCGLLAIGELTASWVSRSRVQAADKGTAVRLEKNVADIRMHEAVLFSYPDEHSPCIVVRIGEEGGAQDFVAYSQKCTHLGCPVVPEPEQNRLYCPCHKGSFELSTGKVLGGPPQHPLPRIGIRITADGYIEAGG